MDTQILDKLQSIIHAYELGVKQTCSTDEIKELCNTFALAKTDDELIDYMQMLEYPMSTYEFRMLMIRIYENV